MFAHMPTDALILDTRLPLEECLAEAFAYLHQEKEAWGAKQGGKGHG